MVRLSYSSSYTLVKVLRWGWTRVSKTNILLAQIGRVDFTFDKVSRDQSDRIVAVEDYGFTRRDAFPFGDCQLPESGLEAVRLGEGDSTNYILYASAHVLKGARRD